MKRGEGVVSVDLLVNLPPPPGVLPSNQIRIRIQSGDGLMYHSTVRGGEFWCGNHNLSPRRGWEGNPSSIRTISYHFWTNLSNSRKE